MPSILIIEDEPELVNVLSAYLQAAGFQVRSAARGDSGLAAWQQSRPDLVLLDLNLPGMDGLDVARAIRRQADTPMIMVTARVEETDRLIGLELGADDYIVKPYSPREVVARVRTVLRRAGAPGGQAGPLPPDPVLRVAELALDPQAHTVTLGAQSVDLTPTEFAVLQTLMEQPGRVFSRLQLLEAAQGTAYEGYERTIDAHIKNLRAKIEPNPRRPRYIHTVFGVGYKLAPGETGED